MGASGDFCMEQQCLVLQGRQVNLSSFQRQQEGQTRRKAADMDGQAQGDMIGERGSKKGNCWHVDRKAHI